MSSNFSGSMHIPHLALGLAVAACLLGGAPELHAQDVDIEELPVPVVDPRGSYPTPSFTFARVVYSSLIDGFRGNPGSWATDWPSADFRLSAVVEQVTGLEANDPVQIELTDSALRQYPFIYIVEGGRLTMSDEEATSLRDYLLGGGFLMVDDFWGERDWEALAFQLRRVFPDREPVEIPMDHEIFRSPYTITETMMLGNIASMASGQGTGERGATEAHFRGLFDDRGRLMAVFCHNTDFGDAWEHGMTPQYPRDILYEYALPMSLNIVAYALLN